ncbi:hypothetical protein ACFU5O_31945 [Streptomyces sp. NPDC057445]|uniref:hypothetical protein n=1 Tax=Streptomyces sp. NPDC057445 TaxID=3346136 RepID=UPI00368836D5
MDEPSQTPQQHKRGMTFAVLHALLQLGPGAHRFQMIAARSTVSRSEVQRRLNQLMAADLVHRPRRGYYELRATTAEMTGTPGLVSPTETPLFDAPVLLQEVHRRTKQVVLLHTYTPVGGERLCIGAAGAYDTLFRQELAITPEAVDGLRQAPLDSDAAGLVILANLAGEDSDLRDDLRRIRSAQLARSESPLPGWDLVSVPLRRLPGAPAYPGAEPRVVGAVSILSPRDSQGAPLVAYGRLLLNAVHVAVERSVVVTRTGVSAPHAA